MDCAWDGGRIVSSNPGPRNQLAGRVAGGAWPDARGWARAPKRRLLCEFGDDGREQMWPSLAGIERGGQCRFGFRQAFPATCADAQFPGEVAQASRAAFDGGTDLSV